jgi:phosphohistidine phosphatase
MNSCRFRMRRQAGPESSARVRERSSTRIVACVKRLHLLRHAKSAWDDPALRDRDRPLAPRGRKAAKRIGRWAKKHGVRPQLVVCSNAVRARQTLERVLPGLGEPAVWFEVTLYAAGTEMLLARIQTLPDEVDEAMLVGHNPGLRDLLLLLAAPSSLRERAHGNVPTGALAELEADVERWADVSPGEARLTKFVVPRELK